MKTFTLEQMLNCLVSMQQGISPELFKTSKDLDTTDFLDLPLCKASELGIDKEFKEYLKKDTNYIG